MDAIDNEKVYAYQAAKVITSTTKVSDIEERIAEYIYEANSEINRLNKENKKLVVYAEKLLSAGKRLFMHTNHAHSCNYTGKRGCDCGVQEARREWNEIAGQPCGHPVSAIVSSGGTNYCKLCEEEWNE